MEKITFETLNERRKKMKKIAKIIYVRVLLCMVIAPILAIIPFFIIAFFVLVFSNIKVFAIIIGCLGAIIGLVAGVYFANATDIPDGGCFSEKVLKRNELELEKPESESTRAVAQRLLEKPWTKLYRQKKKIKYYRIFLMLFPLLLLAIMWTIAGNAAFHANEYLLEYNMDNDDVPIVAILLIGTSCLCGGLCYGIWFSILKRFSHYRCGKCHCVMCFEEDSIKARSSNWTEQKSKDTYGTIGTLYVNGEKAGDVRGTTGSYTLEREVHSFDITHLCHCVHCGKPKTFRERDSFASPWH